MALIGAAQRVHKLHECTVRLAHEEVKQTLVHDVDVPFLLDARHLATRQHLARHKQVENVVGEHVLDKSVPVLTQQLLVTLCHEDIICSSQCHRVTIIKFPPPPSLDEITGIFVMIKILNKLVSRAAPGHQIYIFIKIRLFIIQHESASLNKQHKFFARLYFC